MNDLKLPEAKHGISRWVVDRIPRLLPLLHPGVHPQQWWAAAIIAVNKLDPAKVNDASVLIALANLSQTGLMLGDAMGHAYLVPYKGKCQLQFGYRGFLELAFGNTFLKGVSVECVLRGEETRLRHTEAGKRFRHDMPVNGRPIPTHENIEAAYCTYETKQGFRDVVIVGAPELRELRNSSFDSSPWRSHFAGMCLKTPLRRASKLWRLTKELALAVQLDEESERGQGHRSDDLAIEAPSVEDGPQKMLEATLNGKVGCKTQRDRDEVCIRFSGEKDPTAILRDITRAAEQHGWGSLLEMVLVDQ